MMRYGDLVQFEPITTVIQLQEADNRGEARRLVETYVVSDRIRQQLREIIVPQLQFEKPADNKGLLIVGNYGTGKSHLMAVVSAIAEHSDLAGSMQIPTDEVSAGAIAGKFNVVRVELGSTTRSLRDSLLDELEAALSAWSIEHTFPASDEVTNNKDTLTEAMQKFQERFSDKGLFLVVDELLDYLRTREERELILDLGFLRELGELPQTTRFRFMAGLQESLFDNPRFEFVADPLRRVQARFEQVRIGRQDIAFVVANRLLKKSDEQIARVTNHLQPFAPLYEGMAERMDEFARMFPVHPAYVATFEAVAVAEKREALRTISQAMSQLMHEEVPADQPGLISYDSYWPVLRDNAAMKAVPEVGEVIDKSGVLERKIEQSFTRPVLKPMALRIINGLSLLRLTTDGINAAIGATPQDLRDDLALWVRLPEQSGEFLLDQVQVALKEIMRTVNGQYISYNPENEQYYIDVQKDIDFDQKIRDRGESLSDSQINEAFYDAARQILELSTTTYRNSASRLWLRELPWTDRKVMRPGYLFFTAPDERSTAQPPRDFYVYLLPPFAARDLPTGTQPDEVLFRLVGLGQDFEELMRRYAGARAMANDSPTHRQVYQDHADRALRAIRKWLDEHLYEHLEVTYQGVTASVKQTLPAIGLSPARDLGEILDSVAAAKLAPVFADLYPNYPAFTRLSNPVTEQGRAVAARDAVNAISGRARTAQAAAVLQGLHLLDAEDRLRPAESPYGAHFLALLNAKDPNQVVNLGEVLTKVADGVEGPILRDPKFGMEPEWVAVVLTALAQAGAISIQVGSDALEAGNIERAANTAIEALADFRYFKRPKMLPLQLWSGIFEILGLPPGKLRDERAREETVRELQATVAAEQERVARLDSRKGQGLRLWNTAIFTDNFTIVSEGGAVVGLNSAEVPVTSTEVEAGLRNYKKGLETLARYNTPGKLQNLSLSAADVEDLQQHRAATDRLEKLLEVITQLAPLTTYLVGAQGNLPQAHPWQDRAEQVKASTLAAVRKRAIGEDSPSADKLSRELEALRREYITLYAAQHKRQTLGPEEDDRRARIQHDDRMKVLRELGSVDILDNERVATTGRALVELKTCREFHDGLLNDSPICPSCKLNPSLLANVAPARERLDSIDEGIDRLIADWRTTLVTELNEPEARASIAAMQQDERAPIDAFLKQDGDALSLPSGFVKAANAALRGIETVTVAGDELIAVLQAGGMPVTRKQFEQRLSALLDQRLHGKDVNATRLVLTEAGTNNA